MVVRHNRGFSIVDAEGALEGGLVLPQYSDHVVHFIEGLEERDEVEEFSVVWVVEP